MKEEEENLLADEHNAAMDSETSSLDDILWTISERITNQWLFQLKLNTKSGKYEVQTANELKEYLNTIDDKTLNVEVLKLQMFKDNQQEKAAIILTVRDLLEETDKLKILNDILYEIGDQISLIPLISEKVILSVNGILAEDASKIQEDYSDGVENEDLIHNVRFIIRENGLATLYNEAPVFTGLTDIMLFKSGEQQDTVNLKENVEVMDDNTPNISYKILDSSGQEIPNPENYSPESLGALEVYYMATDDLGRTTKEPRFIWLQSPSVIEVNDENKLIVQEADPTLRDEESVYDYLINLVTVYDLEDDEIPGPGKGVIVTKDNIETDFNPMQTGEYDVTYTVRDSDGNETTTTIQVQVVRSINVSVPLNNIPFQVVTNLLKVEPENPDNEQVITDLNGNGNESTGKEFISGTIKIKNNYFTDVNVSIKSLTISDEDPVNSNGQFNLVNPADINWDDLSEEETMTQMALGLYSKSGLTGDNLPTKDSPIWLTTDINKTSIGVLPKRTFESGESTEAILSFTAQYGKKFTSGKHKMKFSMVLEFE